MGQGFSMAMLNNQMIRWYIVRLDTFLAGKSPEIHFFIRLGFITTGSPVLHPGSHGNWIREIIPEIMAARFRLVKYYNLPRYIYIYIKMDHIHGYMEHINGLYYPLYLYMDEA